MPTLHDVRKLQLMIMDDMGYTDEEVEAKFKGTNIDDSMTLNKIAYDLRIYRPLLWIKFQRENPVFQRFPYSQTG